MLHTRGGRGEGEEGREESRRRDVSPRERDETENERDGEKEREGAYRPRGSAKVEERARHRIKKDARQDSGPGRESRRIELYKS